MRVANAAEMAVAAKIACEGIPEADNILGLTASIYAIARNVVTPAITSVLTVVPFSLSLKSFSKGYSSLKIFYSIIISNTMFFSSILAKFC